MQLEEVVAQVRRHHVTRMNAIRRQGQIDRNLECWVRHHRTDWPERCAAAGPKKLGKADRDRIKKEVAAIIKAARKESADAVLVRHMQASMMARTIWDADRDEADEALQELARELPVHDWWVGLPGRDVGGLASIVGEVAGVLAPLAFGSYAKIEGVWTRLGLAPYKGSALSIWRKEGGLAKSEWEALHYKPARLAVVFTVTQSLLFKQLIGKAKTESGETEADGRYGEIWVKRRKHTAATHPDWTGKHSQMDATRIAAKLLVEDTWQEWRRAAA